MGHWGDAVWWQGHYLAVLATEYALKQRDGENTAATLRELRLALDVYRRLDLNAERCFGDTLPQECNAQGGQLYPFALPFLLFFVVICWFHFRQQR